MNLDTSTWKEFLYPEVFEIRKGFYNKKPEESGLGDIPFIGASACNQGVTSYHTLEEIREASKTGDENNAPLSEKLFPANAVCVTNNGSVGYAYYHDKPFTCSHDVNPLYRKDGIPFNRYTGAFIASVIMADRYRWDYGRKWRPERMQYSKIKLPVTIDGEPDWQWMEDYIKALHSEQITTGCNNPKSLDSVSWGDFPVKELFDVKYGINMELNACTETNKDDPEAIAFVARTSENNGVSAFVKPEKGKTPQPAYTITVAGGGSVLSTFLQIRPFYSGRDLYLLIPKREISNYVKLFIVTVLQAEKYRFNYGRQANKTLPDLNLHLPIASDGKPNWQFMEDYIKSLPYGDRIIEAEQ